MNYTNHIKKWHVYELRQNIGECGWSWVLSNPDETASYPMRTDELGNHIYYKDRPILRKTGIGMHIDSKMRYKDYRKQYKKIYRRVVISVTTSKFWKPVLENDANELKI